MKIALNLSTSVERGGRFALLWAMPAVLVGLVGLFFLGRATLDALRDYQNVHRGVAGVQERQGRLKAREGEIKRELAQPQFRQIYHDVQFVNGLIEKKRLSLTTLAERLTTLMPPEVRLTGLALGQKLDGTHVVRLMVSGRSEDAVETLLSNLEDSPDFKEVAITDQGFEQEGAAGGPVNITVTARYFPGER